MFSQAGIVRDAGGLKDLLVTIKSLKDKQKEILKNDKSTAVVKLGMMLDVAQAICLSALMREESRGSHFRADYPDQREDYLGNFVIKKVKEEMEIRFVPSQNKAT